MEIDYESKAVRKILDLQFEMIGEDITFAQLPVDGLIEVTEKKKVKKKPWTEIYMFPDESTYLKWKDIARAVLKEDGMAPLEIDMLDMVYGMHYKRKAPN